MSVDSCCLWNHSRVDSCCEVRMQVTVSTIVLHMVVTMHGCPFLHFQYPLEHERVE
ncbi:hypothetical protein Hanom_Chr09g00827011 [Helianthus anomalus]